MYPPNPQLKGSSSLFFKKRIANVHTKIFIQIFIDFLMKIRSNLNVLHLANGETNSNSFIL
jgi:hypothetical protein